MKRIAYISFITFVISCLFNLSFGNENVSFECSNNRHIQSLPDLNIDESMIKIGKLSKGNQNKPYVALTFDGGSNANAAPFILETLEKMNVFSTFFLTGEFIKTYPDLTRDIAELGHEVANHTFTHPHLIENICSKNKKVIITKENLQNELLQTEQLFWETTGFSMVRFWRAPYGETNNDIVTWANEIGYIHVFWTHKKGKSMDTMDWVSDKNCSLYRSSEEIKSCILDYDDGVNGGANGSIILMHLGSQRTNDQPYTVLGEIIEEMRSKGYEFVKVSELLQ